ncbi:hypothetical protein [Heyndrickxia oleronia]|uniref:hypothetical protein n=1 Tax=Heyndrickxia oleronia TaxID=38875 RepID=UPI001C0F1256|nr:hypothetical protein [Heyndrickxia oleronia]MBU5212475.1 hypothetical protein [Heyndrickxia oleronia]
MKKVKFFIKFIVPMMAFVLIFSQVFSFPAEANSLQVENEKEQAIYALQESFGYSKEEALELYEQVNSTSKYYTTSKDGSISFDSESALENGVDPSVVAQITSDLDKIGKNNLKNLNSTLASCKGMTFFDPGQYRAYFDNCKTEDVVFYLTVAAGIVTIAGLIVSFIGCPIGVSLQIAGVITGLEAAYLNHINKGCGVYIYYYGPYLGARSQTCS